MYPTIVGLIMIAVGAVLILLSQHIAKITGSWNRFSLGIETPENWGRGGTIVVGAVMAFYGLLILLRLVAIS